MIDWKRKLTSRKWWIACAAFVVALVAFFHVDSGTAERVGALILLMGDVIAYTLAEGWTDAAEKGATNEGD